MKDFITSTKPHKVTSLGISASMQAVLATLPRTGVLKRATSGLVYLKIDNNYIDNIFPLIQGENISKPTYSDETTQPINAHISVIYPQEPQENLIHEYEDKAYTFVVHDLLKVELVEMIYYDLWITAPELIKFRQMNHLPEKLQICGYASDLHITIGVTAIKVITPV